MEDPARTVFTYHQETKHHYNRYARSPGYMDWANQPDPFRRFEGAVTVPLPLLSGDPGVEYRGLYQRDDTARQPLTRESVAAFLELSMGLSAWKSYGGNRWALRMNPSSGNLHPTECHVLLPDMPGLRSGVYHYNPHDHALAGRTRIPDEIWTAMRDYFGEEALFLTGLTSIYWREAWKYGERAFRYCNHDVGHALAALSFSAALQGWGMTALTCPSHRDTTDLLGLERTAWHPGEAEDGEIICAVHRPGLSLSPTLPRSIVERFRSLEWTGAPLPLSERVVPWQVIDAAARVTRKPETDDVPPDLPDPPAREAPNAPFSAAQVIRKRRSAVMMDGGGGLDREGLFQMLDRTLPRRGHAPFDLGIGPARTDLLLFVHEVAGLPPGLYWFLRTAGTPDALRQSMDSRFRWEPAVAGFPLFLLESGDVRDRATGVSCHQEIAGSGSFSAAMVARFRKVVAAAPYRYRHLFWETGMVGQVLYLAAEAQGISGTGIGCFFDDPVHDLLGLRDDSLQSLYHFTVGRSVPDHRLTTQPPYVHLDRRPGEAVRPHR